MDSQCCPKQDAVSISFIFPMYEIEENSLQDHLRNYMERLKFVISCIFILCLRLPLLFHHFSPKLLFPSLLPRLSSFHQFQVPLPPAFPSPNPRNPDSVQPGAFAVTLHLSAHCTQRCFRTFPPSWATCSSVSLLSADHSLSDFPLFWLIY